MQLEEVKKLAEMARIDMSDEEMTEIAHDFDSILAYVGQIQEASKSIGVPPPLDKGRTEEGCINVMREDEATNTPGEFTERITALMPDTQDGYLKVKQIL